MTSIRIRLIIMGSLGAIAIVLLGITGNYVVASAQQSTAKDSAITLDLTETKKLWANRDPKSSDDWTRCRDQAQAIYSQYDGQRVRIEDTYSWGFETSKIGDIWVDFPEQPNPELIASMAKLKNYPRTLKTNNTRIRLYGKLSCKEGESYGHLGGSSALLLVDQMEILQASP